MDKPEALERVSEALEQAVRVLLEETTDPTPKPSQAVVVVGDLEIDAPAWSVKRRGREVSLSPTHFRLLLCLSEHVDQVVMYDDIARLLWQDKALLYSREAITNLVGKLRRRLGDGAITPRYIVAVPGVGYRLQSVAGRGARVRPRRGM